MSAFQSSNNKMHFSLLFFVFISKIYHMFDNTIPTTSFVYFLSFILTTTSTMDISLKSLGILVNNLSNKLLSS